MTKDPKDGQSKMAGKVTYSEAAPIAESAATSADTSIVDINADETIDDDVVETETEPQTGVNLLAVADIRVNFGVSQAQIDLEVLVRARKIMQDPARFMAVKAIAGGTQI